MLLFAPTDPLSDWKVMMISVPVAAAGFESELPALPLVDPPGLIAVSRDARSRPQQRALRGNDAPPQCCK